MELLSILCALLPIIFSLKPVYSDAASVGINYGRIADDLPPPQQVVQLIKSLGITKIKAYDTDSTVLSALSGSGISVTVALPNDKLSAVASNQAYADDWIRSNVLRYYPKTVIDAIAVGNEVFADPNNITPFLVPAMKNVFASLVKYRAASKIKVSSPLALGALQSSYPPSAGSFQPDLVKPVIKPMLDFLKQTGSYLMINVYPFFAYSANTDVISLDYALFRNNSGNVDSNNGLLYKSLFDAQIDAVYAAMAKLGFNNVKLVVSETGWPSNGDKNEIGAGLDNAATYNGNLVRRVLTGGGTPLHPKNPLNVYLFALFNENKKPGPTSERNYGLFYPNTKKVYDIPLTAHDVADSPGGKSQAGKTWCVADDKTDANKLQEGLDYACGEGGADCGPIQPGGKCYYPDTLPAHASYAFNSYYQKHNRASGTCYFGGAAYVVFQPPKFGSCEYPTGN